MRYFLIIFCFAFLASNAQDESGVIMLSTNNGLTNNAVTTLYQDSIGFIWIGTEEGLNRYDGYSIKNYIHIIDQPTSIVGNKINDILPDENGNLWISTFFNGISYYNYSQDAFVNFTNSEENLYSLSNNMVNATTFDNNGYLWLATYFGLTSIERKTLKVNKGITGFTLVFNESVKQRMKHVNVPDEIISKMQTMNGFKFNTISDLEKKTISVIGKEAFLQNHKKMFVSSYLNFDQESLLDERVIAVVSDNKNGLWSGIVDYGLRYTNTKTNQTILIKANGLENSMTANDIASLYYTKDDNIWIGGLSGGLIDTM
ncbi:MAG: hypothetical protein IPO21_09995 [Bacteroidales bacterium]|nr:hypothetical protein [Bacteroidales bacterium]